MQLCYIKLKVLKLSIKWKVKTFRSNKNLIYRKNTDSQYLYPMEHLFYTFKETLNIVKT